MDKREVLIQICEHPGWEPPNDGNGIERHLDELQREGWILMRLDGFSATAKALEAYPSFTEQADIADDPPGPPPPPTPGGENIGRRPVSPELREGVVPEERVLVLLVGLLRTMPVIEVFSLALHPAYRDGPEFEVARALIEEMRK